MLSEVVDSILKFMVEKEASDIEIGGFGTNGHIWFRIYGQKNPVVFNRLIGQPQVSEHFTATNFKPAIVVAVVGLSHIVGIAVNNAASRAMAGHRLPLCHGQI